ncbi:uncharacterized protein LOC121370463 [Gigantopelta aegis]|uniref:uncharacterized protein LOC121370463 n=1 Tax=Gigantopelta aegis TaxID=1735272 RepID=UPI001B88E163|nr:uncharacterized protein LOC121370463 [Gigantopelta aegis]XP_041351648.1 uncharacterized protein LOC121370463 [Gigantopelta aegis]
MENDLHQRILTTQSSTESEYDSDMELDFHRHEREEHAASEEEEEHILVDPGPFRYNKRLCAVSLPCFLMIVTMTGEVLLSIITVGTALLLLLSQIGETRRSVIVFIILFVPCHILVFFSVVPLIWLSLWNLFLIAAINMYVILTASWALLQFTSFRMEEHYLCEVMELLLFSVYPGVCILMMTWAVAIVTQLQMTPFILLGIGFVVLQLFLVPSLSSFRSTTTAEEDLNVLQQPFVAMIVCVFCLFPSILHCLLALFAPVDHIFSKTSMIQLLFTASFSLFLTTLINIRQFFEYAGWQYTIVIRVRWTSGMIATLLLFPVLQKFNLSSHFVPWLPGCIVAFAILGLFLSHRNYWLASLLLMMGLTSFHSYWIFVLPWQIKYYLLDNIHIDNFFVLLTINFLLCLACLYVATHSSSELMGFLICVQSFVLVLCEIVLLRSDLCSISVSVTIGVLATYMLYRLHISGKISERAVLFSSSIHLVKIISVLLPEISHTQEKITLMNYICLFYLVFVVLKTFVYETKEEMSTRKVFTSLALLLFSLALNTYPILLLLCQNLLNPKPAVIELIGMWFVTGGLVTIPFSQVHVQAASNLNRITLLMLLAGACVLGIHPDIAFSLSSLFQWGEITSFLLLSAVLSSNVSMTPTSVFIAAFTAGFCSAYTIVMQLYGDIPSVFHVVFYIGAISATLLLCIIYFKAESLSHIIERTIKQAYLLLGISFFVLLILDIVFMDSSQSVTSLPVLKVMLVTTACASIILKMLSFKKDSNNLPITKPKEEKSVSVIPLIGNVSTIVAFLLACTQGPEGFLHDMWCCASSLILFCLQKDMRLFHNLTEDNHMTPTLMCCVCMLTIASLCRNNMFIATGLLTVFCGVMEILMTAATVPVYIVLWGILWKDEILSEKAVVFTVPLNMVLFFVGSSYTTWALATSGLIAGVWLMIAKLPMLPSGVDYMDS